MIHNKYDEIIDMDINWLDLISHKKDKNKLDRFGSISRTISSAEIIISRHNNQKDENESFHVWIDNEGVFIDGCNIKPNSIDFSDLIQNPNSSTHSQSRDA